MWHSSRSHDPAPEAVLPAIEWPAPPVWRAVDRSRAGGTEVSAQGGGHGTAYILSDGSSQDSCARDSRCLMGTVALT